MSMTTATRLKRKEAASYLASRWGVTVAPSSLAKYASVGGGPAYQKFGKTPLYTEADLDEWAEGKLGPKARNTTELKALERANAPA